MMISTPVRLLVLTCSLISGRGAFGQTFGSIDGEARDVTGAAVVGVTVSGASQGTNAVRSVVTNDAGAYSFPSFAPGTYTLRAEKPGFKAAVLNRIELQVQQAACIDIDLQVGQVSESLEVHAEAEARLTDDATAGTVIDNKRIAELPLNGRNYLRLVSLAPMFRPGFPARGKLSQGKAVFVPAKRWRSAASALTSITTRWME